MKKVFKDCFEFFNAFNILKKKSGAEKTAIYDIACCIISL